MAGQSETRPPYAWRALRLIAVGLSVLLAFLVLLIALGYFDPKPLGPLLRVDQPGIYSMSEGEALVLSQYPPWPAAATVERFSVRLTAANLGGELDSGFGLALSDKSRQLVVAVTSLGYIAVWENDPEGKPAYILPWETWPHVLTGQQPNELWLDVALSPNGSAITARINRELLWQEEVDFTPREAGLWLGSFGGSATVDFQKLEWFADPQG
jgi:hypothetical protein